MNVCPNCLNFNIGNDETMVSLFVSLTDAGNDGWGGVILAFKQETKVVASVGSLFTYGDTYGPTEVSIP